MGIVTFGAFGHGKLLAEHLPKPFLDDGFAIASRDSYHGFCKLSTLVGSQGLKRSAGIADRDETG